MGILLGCFMAPTAHFFIILILVTILLLIGDLFTSKGQFAYQCRWISGVMIHLVILGIGAWLTLQCLSKTQVELPQCEASFKVRILHSPEEKIRSTLCHAIIERSKQDTLFRKSSDHVILYFEKNDRSASLNRGDILLIKTRFNPPVRTHNPGNFDYAIYLQQQGIVGTAYVASQNWVRIGSKHEQSLRALAEKCQACLLDIYRKYDIEAEEFGVLAALTLGYKESLDSDLQASYSGSGAMHILAVSGLHVGIIYIVFNFIFSFVFRHKKLRVPSNILILILLWIYAFVTGLTPSVLRATIMFSFVVVGNCFGSKSPTSNRIAASAFLLLLFNPMLLFSVGFQLSYSAVLAIIYFHPKISKLIHLRSKPMRWLWDLVSVSIAAQIGTAPWGLLYFNHFSNYFLLTNIVAIPMASVIIYTALVLLTISPIVILGKPIAMLLDHEVEFLNWSVVGIEQLSYSVSDIAIDKLQVALLFGAIVLFSFFEEERKFLFLGSGLCLLLFFFLVNIQRQFDTLCSEKLVIYSDNKNVIIQQTHGKANLILTSDSCSTDFLTRNFSLINKLNDAEIIPLNGKNETLTENCFLFGNKKFMVIHHDLSLMKITQHRVHTDYLLLGKIGYTQLETLLDAIHTKEIILLGSFPSWRIEEMTLLAEQNSIALYNIGAKGAWKKQKRRYLSPKKLF